ncbi:short-chain oxidoreductase [Mycena capillaripes]|nr:short-chain oxidoreductase [Mycena capillaripes]
MSSKLVWLITGTSAGLGRDLALAALRRGDHVIATARSVTKLTDLNDKGADVLELDVTAPLDQLHAVAKKAAAIHGRIDVVVNNAGYILVGAVEESTPEETLQQFNTNVFGALNVTRAILPYMRAKKSGTVVFMGSVGGWHGLVNAGLYCATKYTLRGISESLHLEIAPLGLRSTCIDFGYFRTTFLDPAHRAPYIPRIEDYNEITKKSNDALLAYDGKQPGDPAKGVEVVIDIVRGEGLAAGKAFPTSVALGSDCYKVIKAEAEAVLARLEEWRPLSESTDF